MNEQARKQELHNYAGLGKLHYRDHEFQFHNDVLPGMTCLSSAKANSVLSVSYGELFQHHWQSTTILATGGNTL